MDVEAVEIQDWELLQPNPNLENSGLVDSAENRSNTEGIGADPEGMVDSSYFTVDSQNRRVNTLSRADASEAGSEASDNLNRVDPGSDSRCRRKDPGESWSDSGGIQTDGLKIEESEEREVSSVEKDENLREGSEDSETRKAEEARKSVVWWKAPCVFLKYSVLRISPVWTFSVAAAVMGFLVLGRHFYKMRKKSRSVDIKVAMDDKVSRFVSRASRLNEAFSAVRRVPVIRLPGAGAMPWPVMSLR